jgi:CheY-like chemotaxis protein
MAQTPHSSSNESPNLTPWRVLVVDDNIPSAKTSGWTLEILGFEVKLAHDGEAALRCAAEWQPRAVLLDIGLPGMDGYEVCRRLRADARLADTIIIAQTGWAEEEHRRRTSEEGFDYHLVKPVEISALEKLMRQAQSKAEREAA